MREEVLWTVRRNTPPPPPPPQTVMELFSDLEEKEAAREVGIPGVRVQTGRQLRDPAWYSGDRY